MIFPVLRGILTPLLTPATWFLLAVNFIVFLFNYGSYRVSQRELDAVFQNEKFLQVQGAAFAQAVEQAPKAYSKVVRTFAERAVQGDTYSREVLGGLAFRNRAFMQNAETMTFDGDEIAIAKWKDEFVELRKVQEKHPNYKWGLSAAHSGFRNWVTYQFAHSGWQHLIFLNMIYLALFGTFLEVTLGSSLVILTYLLSGFAGAAFFIAVGGLSNSPLIGASGAISGLMACLATYKWKENIRFAYFLFLVPGYAGLRELPAWLLIVLYFIPDIAGSLSSYPDMNGVAYTAHIGGALFGGFIGYAARRGWLEAEPLAENASTTTTT